MPPPIKQLAVPKHGEVGKRFKERASRGSRVLEVIRREPDKLARIVRYVGSDPMYDEKAEAAWRLVVVEGDHKASWRRPPEHGKRETVIRDDILGRLFIEVKDE